MKLKSTSSMSSHTCIPSLPTTRIGIIGLKQYTCESKVYYTTLSFSISNLTWDNQWILDLLWYDLHQNITIHWPLAMLIIATTTDKLFYSELKIIKTLLVCNKPNEYGRHEQWKTWSNLTLIASNSVRN